MEPDTTIVAEFGIFATWPMQWAHYDGGFFVDSWNGEFGGDLVAQFHLFWRSSTDWSHRPVVRECQNRCFLYRCSFLVSLSVIEIRLITSIIQHSKKYSDVRCLMDVWFLNLLVCLWKINKISWQRWNVSHYNHFWIRDQLSRREHRTNLIIGYFLFLYYHIYRASNKHQVILFGYFFYPFNHIGL